MVGGGWGGVEAGVAMWGGAVGISASTAMGVGSRASTAPEPLLCEASRASRQPRSPVHQGGPGIHRIS